MRALFAPLTVLLALALATTGDLRAQVVPGQPTAPQPATPQPGGSGQSIEVAPARGAGWTFTPSMALGVVWDSNPALVNEGFNQDVAGDRLLMITPSGDVAYEGRQTLFGTGYEGAWQRYSSLSALDSYDQRMHTSLVFKANPRLTWFGSNNFAELPTTEQTLLNGVPFRRVGSKVDNLRGGAEARLTKYTTLRASYEFIYAAFDQQRLLPSFVLGGHSNGALMQLDHRISEQTSIGGIYELRVASINTAVGSNQPLTFQQGGGTIDYHIASTTLLSFAGGLSILVDPNLNTTANPDLSSTHVGPFIRAGITHHLETATLSGGYERSYVPTFGFAASTQSEQVYGAVTMPIDRNRAYVQVSTTWRRNNPLIKTEGTLNSYWLDGTVGYPVSRWARAEAFFGVARQDAGVAGGLVNRHRVGFQVVLWTPMRIR
jgi:hypothetical protein